MYAQGLTLTNVHPLYNMRNCSVTKLGIFEKPCDSFFNKSSQIYGDFVIQVKLAAVSFWRQTFWKIGLHHLVTLITCHSGL